MHLSSQKSAAFVCISPSLTDHGRSDATTLAIAWLAVILIAGLGYVFVDEDHRLCMLSVKTQDVVVLG